MDTLASAPAAPIGPRTGITDTAKCATSVIEESYISRDDIGLWSVADGMGGHQAGDMASQMVVAALQTVAPCDDIHELLDATRLALNNANSELPLA